MSMNFMLLSGILATIVPSIGNTIEMRRISGYVRASDGIGIFLAKVSTSDGTCTDTDFAGYYCISVPQHWSGQVTPRIQGYDFKVVPYRNYNNVTSDLIHQDFIGSSTNTTIETTENMLTLIELNPVDSQGNPVTFSPVVVGLPKHASFNPQTNTLLWRPWYTDAGTYELLFKDINSDYIQKINIKVEDASLQPWYQDWIQDATIKSTMVEY
jgi:hypothetical protein